MLHRIPVRALASWLVPVVAVVLLAPVVPAQEGGEKIYAQLLKSTVWVRPIDDEGASRRSGSGVLIDAKRNLIVTNYHVVSDDKRAVVFFPILQKNKLVVERMTYLDLFRLGVCPSNPWFSSAAGHCSWPVAVE